MKTLMLAAALAAAAPAFAKIPDSPARDLAGKIAGKPVQCLPGFARDRESRTYASGDILYGGTGSTKYLNHPSGCPRFRSDMAIISVTPGPLCRGDIIRLVDPLSGMFYGACPLGDFTPYDKPSK